MTLQGVASYDPPPGDNEEHSERVADATDGDPATYLDDGELPAERSRSPASASC